MITFKVAILDLHKGAPNQGMRNIHELIDGFSIDHDIFLEKVVFDVRGAHEIPSLDFDIYFSSGGPGSPVDPEGWEEDYIRWFENIREHNRVSQQKKFVFLICHSFQIICHHYKLANVCLRRKESFGVFPVHLTENGKADPVFKLLTDPFYAVDSRKWQVIDPDDDALDKMGAKILGLEKKRPHVPLQRAVMAIRFTPEILGTQFHPEADARGMIYHLQTEERKKFVTETYGQERYEDLILHLNDPDKIMLTHRIIIPEFLTGAVESLIQLN